MHVQRARCWTSHQCRNATPMDGARTTPLPSLGPAGRPAARLHAKAPHIWQAAARGPACLADLRLRARGGAPKLVEANVEPLVNGLQTRRRTVVSRRREVVCTTRLDQACQQQRAPIPRRLAGEVSSRAGRLQGIWPAAAETSGRSPVRLLGAPSASSPRPPRLRATCHACQPHVPLRVPSPGKLGPQTPPTASNAWARWAGSAAPSPCGWHGTYRRSAGR